MTSPLPAWVRRIEFAGMVALMSCAIPALQGQVAVTGVTYGTATNGTNRTADEIVYDNRFRPVQNISTANMVYTFDGQIAQDAYFRRNTGSGNPNNSTVFYQYTNDDPVTVYGTGDTSPTMEEVMLSNDLSQGLRNPFANDDSSSSSLSTNIERIDFYMPNHVVQAGEAFVFFDLENVGNFGDGFRIAAFSTWGTYNSTAAPTAYANAGLLVGADTFGNPVATPDGSNARYLRSTTTNGDNLAANQTIATLDSNASSAQDLSLVGIVIRLSDLGLEAGQTIQGFSLMAGDVAASSANDLLNWNNSNVYKTNTSSANWGNMDFMGFGGKVARPVPEPSTYGLIFASACGLLWFWRRRQGRAAA